MLNKKIIILVITGLHVWEWHSKQKLACFMSLCVHLNSIWAEVWSNFIVFFRENGGVDDVPNNCLIIKDLDNI